VPCIDAPTFTHRLLRGSVLITLALGLSACQWLPSAAPTSGQKAAPPVQDAKPARSDAHTAVDEVDQRIDARPSPTTGKGKAGLRGVAAVKAQPVVKLAPPARPGSLADARLQAARRLVAANPGITYTSRPPDVLLAIPVLTVDLHADGSIRRIEVMRYPRQAKDTVEMAKEALRRAAPFGNVSHLPRPWRFNETFLFNDQRQFKPLTLDR
jgi:hypothetical protein